MHNVTVKVILDTRRPKKDDSFPVKLRLTYKMKQKYFPLGFSMTCGEWEKLENPKTRDANIRQLKIQFAAVVQKANETIQKLRYFSFEEFSHLFNESPIDDLDVLSLLERKKAILQKQDRLSSAESYQSTIQSLRSYLKVKNKRELTLIGISSEWLNGYEQWMREASKSLSTIGIYLRNLRTIFNEAIEKGLIDKSVYPFGKRKYMIPSGVNKKKALSIKDIEKVFQYQTVYETEHWAKDMWILSYLCNGINIKDIALLKYKNIGKKTLAFIRAKTERSTKSNQSEIQVSLIPEIEAIIKSWGTKPKQPEKYVFGILENNDSSAEQLAKIKQATKTINKYMKRIGETLEFDMPLTTYTARHSFATVLKRSGAPIEFISESLGHKDLKTTENYLDSFEDETREKYQRKLLDFS